MNQATRIGGWAVAVAVGVVLGAILFRRGEPRMPAPRPAVPVKADAHPPAAEELARANERIGALEAQLRSLQQKVESRGADKEALLKDLKEAALREADAAGDGFEEKDALPFGWRVPNRPQSVAGVLGLDAARRKSLEETYQSFVDRIRRLEKEHAKTTVDEDTTRIEIAPFPAEGKALIDEWSARLATILTPDEKDKYKKLGLGLLPADVGQAERVIAIVNEGEGMASATEHSGDGKGGSSYYKGPKGLALAPYNHLLKK